MSTRDSLIEALGPILSSTEGLGAIKLVKSVRATDTLSKPVLIVKTISFVKLPQAPIGNMMGEFLLTLVTNHVDVERGENQLDDLLAILLPTLFTNKIVWTSATQVSFDDTHIAYDIAVSTILR